MTDAAAPAHKDVTAALLDVAYHHEPYWSPGQGDWIKSLLKEPPTPASPRSCANSYESGADFVAKRTRPAPTPTSPGPAAPGR